MRGGPSNGRYFQVLLAVLFCIGLVANVEASPRTAYPRCATAGGPPSAADSEGAKELQRSIATSPLFRKTAAASRVQACTVSFESDGRFSLEYRFGGGQSMRVEHDLNIEYTSIATTVRLAPGDHAETLLTQAERWSFGKDGCGLDMPHPDTKAVKGEPGVRETTYEGSVCNCRGTIRHDTKRQLTGFVLTSAC